MYVDDLTIYHSFHHNEDQEAEKVINAECSKIIAWHSANDLQINPSKTKLLFMGQMKRVEKCKEKMNIEVQELQATNTVKLLGVVLDQKLTYSEHIEQVCKKCSKLLYRISRIRPLLTKKTTEKLMNATVMSRMMYCSTLFTTANKDAIRQLQCMQNYAVKILTQQYKA